MAQLRNFADPLKAAMPEDEQRCCRLTVIALFKYRSFISPTIVRKLNKFE